MKNKPQFLFVLIVVLTVSSCEKSIKNYDASGSFEAVERLISAEATGKITELQIEEGQLLAEGQEIGQVDVSNLNLQAAQVEAIIDAISKKTNNANAQVGILEAQLKSQDSQMEPIKRQIEIADKEINRFNKLAASNAIPQKQLDDLRDNKSVIEKQLEAIQSQRQVIQAQISAAKSNVYIQNRAILSEIEPNQKRLEIIQKQIDDGVIVNEFKGTVTSKLAYDGEFTNMGKPMYKIADLSEIILRAYVSGDQLALIKLKQEVKVLTDDGEGGFKETTGVITWISSKAEFTPKTIQTKNERANLVYAIKVKVANDGSYKIGMYGELKF